MLEVHNDGRSAVSTGSREEMERDVQAMHEYGLWATMEKQRADVSGFTRHRRSGRVIATFTGFEADLLRSLASQLVELLRNEAAVPRRRRPTRSRRMLDFSGPTTEPEDPVLARLFPTAYPDDEEAAAEFRRFTEGGAARRQGGRRGPIIDDLEEAGLPPELDRGRAGDRRRARPGRGRDLDARRSPTSGSRWPPGSGSRTATRTTGTRCPTTTRAPRPTTSTSGSATSRRPSSRRSPREAPDEPGPRLRRRHPGEDRQRPPVVAAGRDRGRTPRRRGAAGQAVGQRPVDARHGHRGPRRGAGGGRGPGGDGGDRRARARGPAGLDRRPPRDRARQR